MALATWNLCCPRCGHPDPTDFRGDRHEPPSVLGLRVLKRCDACAGTAPASAWSWVRQPPRRAA